MAEQTPPGPKTSGRVAGVVAIAAILVGGYYGLIAKPNSEKAPTPGQEASTPPADAKAPDGQTAEADKTPEPAKAAESAAPADAAAPGAEQQAEAPAEGAVPSFDIVRVEPTGETVVAGLAAPKSKVELLDGSSTVATAEANERGEWAVAIEKPLAPGTHDLSIRTTSPDKKVETLSEQSVAVQVQEPGKGEALVVLNTPDTASKVLQKPEVPGEPQVAAATPEQPKAPEPSQPASGSQAADNAGTPTGAPAAEKPAAAGAEDNGSQTATADAGAAKPGDQSQQQASAGTGQAAGEPSPAPDGTEKPAASADGPAVTADASKPAAEPKVTVDAVEVEDGKLFVAGSAQSKAPVRVYMDDKLVGEAKPEENGRWLLETKRSVEPGRRIVRADQVEADGSGKVVERAEVPFERTEDVAMLAPVVATGGGASGAAADGNVPAPQNVIIRRGDNLWTISRRLYGRGIRYSTIYEANHDQIRSPHLIYPGQTFVLPTGDANWTN